MSTAFDGLMSEFIKALVNDFNLDEKEVKSTWEKINKQKAAQALPSPSQASQLPMKQSAELMKLTKAELSEHCKANN